MSKYTSAPDGFCDDCGIRLSMHDDPRDCDGAERRVEALERMERLFLGVANSPERSGR